MTGFLGFHSPTPAPRLSKTRAPPQTHFTRDAPAASVHCALAPGAKYVNDAGVALASRAKRHVAVMSVPHASFKARSTSVRAGTYACVLGVGVVIGGRGDPGVSAFFFDTASAEPRRGGGPGIGPTFLSSVAKKPPMSWSCGTSRMHRSRGGPLMRLPSLVTPEALGGNTERANARRNPGEIVASSLRVSSNVFHSVIAPSSSAVSTFQVVIPARRRKPRTRSLASTISTAPPHFSTSAATTASFSTGLKLHVLYTMYPPTFRSATPLSAMRNCSACSPIANSGRHSFQICGFLRNVPSPEHGTSQMIRSNVPAGYRVWEPSVPRAHAEGDSEIGALGLGNHCAWWFVTISASVAAPSAAHRLTKK